MKTRTKWLNMGLIMLSFSKNPVVTESHSHIVFLFDVEELTFLISIICAFSCMI